MIVYTVHEPVPPSSSIEKRTEQVTFVREGFTWLGFLLPLPWLLFNRLWLEFLAALGLLAGLGALGMAAGMSEASAGILSLMLNFIVGFEGNDLKRWKLERRGYAFLASVVGRDFDEVERRFFDAWYPTISGGPDLVPRRSGSPAAAPPQSQPWSTAPVIGTLPSAGA